MSLTRADVMCRQDLANEICRGIYPQTKSFFDRLRLKPKYGFKILNAPPHCNAPILFIGYQPGGGSRDFEIEVAKGTDKGWPPVCEYATEDWVLSRRMREMFGKNRLEQCVGTNAIFLRYPDAGEYREDIGAVRASVESYCTAKVSQIVEAITPQRIVAIGFAALQLFGATKPDLKSKEGRTLTKIGTIAGRPAIGMLHLTGARISKKDFGLIRDRLLQEKHRKGSN